MGKVNRKVVLGIDPGETTGYALCTVTKEKTVVDAYGHLNGESLLQEGFDQFMPGAGMYSEHRAVVHALMSIVADARPHAIAIEDFVLRQFTTMDRSGISPHGIIHMLEVWLYEIMPHEVQVPDVHYYTSSQSKNVVTDTRLRQLDLWIPGFQHARDAVRLVDLYRRKVMAAEQ